MRKIFEVQGFGDKQVASIFHMLSQMIKKFIKKKTILETNALFHFHFNKLHKNTSIHFLEKEYSSPYQHFIYYFKNVFSNLRIKIE